LTTKKLDAIITKIVLNEDYMNKEYKTAGTYTKSARIVSDYENDLIFEQPRAGLMSQELVSYENIDIGVKRTVTTRVFTTNGDYNDNTTITILPNTI
jgi:hypothetical protein